MTIEIIDITPDGKMVIGPAEATGNQLDALHDSLLWQVQSRTVPSHINGEMIGEPIAPYDDAWGCGMSVAGKKRVHGAKLVL